MKKVSLQLRAPQAQKVFLAGTFTDWAIQAKRMPRKRNSKYTFVTSIKLAPGTYEYKFIVDEAWMEDPAAQSSRQNEFGGQNSLITVK